eukprot:7381481-Heterocapsa_arctica.AAC.1
MNTHQSGPHSATCYSRRTGTNSRLERGTRTKKAVELEKPPILVLEMKTNSSRKQKLVDFFHQMHSPKDDKAERCRERGYTFESIRGDGNCLYTSLGKSRKFSGNQVRQIIHSRAAEYWQQCMEYDID